MNTYNIWPPIKGKIISVKKPNIDTLFVGRVYKEIQVPHNIDSNKACLILLMNNNNYADDELTKINYNKLGNNKGLLLVYPNYNWKYMEDDLLNTESDKLSYINNIAKGYMNFKTNILHQGGADIETQKQPQIQEQPQTQEQPQIQEQPQTQEQPQIQPQMQELPSIIEPPTEDVIESPIIGPQTTEEIKTTSPIIPLESQIDLTETIYDQKPNNCSGTDDIKFDYILTESGEQNLNNLFIDDKTLIEITETPFIPPDAIQSLKLKKQLDFILPVNINELKLVINPGVALDNLILRKEDEIDEGNKIINWLKDQFNTTENEIIQGLKLFTHNG